MSSQPPKFLTFRICLGILCLYAFASYFDSAHAAETDKPIITPSGIVIVIPIPPAYTDPVFA
jgi:hypothetical protein